MGGYGLPPALTTTTHAAAEQNVIRMQADTVLAIDKLLISNTGVDAVSDTELDLRQGTIFGNVKKLSATSQYLIKMPNGIAGVRGTTFIISANGDITVIVWLHGGFLCQRQRPGRPPECLAPATSSIPGHRPDHPSHAGAIEQRGRNRCFYRDRHGG